MFVYNIDIIIRSIFVNRKKNIEKFIFLSKVKVLNTIYRNGNNYIKGIICNYNYKFIEKQKIKVILIKKKEKL